MKTIREENEAFLGEEYDFEKIKKYLHNSKLLWINSGKDYDDVKSYVNKNNIYTIYVRKEYIHIANKILWECKTMEIVTIVDSNNPYEIEQKVGRLSNKKLWDFFAANSLSQIGQGGWYHAFSGNIFSEAEMKEYEENVFTKLRKFIDRRKVVLEIGCASGLTMFRIAPYVKTYIGTDMGEVSIKKNMERVQNNNMDNIIVLQCEANKIIDLDIQLKVDIVIINSVVQLFPGINYLKEVIEQACIFLETEGIIFLGDIMDLATKENLLNNLKKIGKENFKAVSYKDVQSQLFLSKEYFQYLQSIVDGICDVEISDKIGNIRNELTDYRYDVILKFNKNIKKGKNDSKKRQRAIEIL